MVDVMIDIYLKDDITLGIVHPYDNILYAKIKAVPKARFRDGHWSIPLLQLSNITSALVGHDYRVYEDAQQAFDTAVKSLLIIIEGNTCNIQNVLDRQVYSEIDQASRFRWKDAIHMQRHLRQARNFHFDGYKHLFHSNKFPIGLLDRVKTIAAKYYKEVKVIDKRTIPNTVLTLPRINVVFRPIQTQVIDKATEMRNGIISLPPGVGKTEVACGIIYKLRYPTLFLTHTKTLAKQSRQRLKRRLGTDIGIIGLGEKIIHPINIGMVQTFNSILKKRVNNRTPIEHEAVKFLRDAPVMILDESHHGSSKIFEKCLKNSHAVYRYGLTATPYREAEDELIFHAQLGEFIVQMSLKQAVEDGHLARPVFVFHKYEATYDYKNATGAYKDYYRDNIVNNEVRNNMIRDLAIRQVKENHIVLILVNIIDHGRILKDLIKKGCDEVEFIYGHTDDDIRDEVLNLMRERTLKIVIATQILDEGADIPSISTFINAVGGKGKARYIQRSGRALRKYPGKDTAFIFDFIDNDQSYLQDHSIRRMEIVNEEGFKCSIV